MAIRIEIHPQTPAPAIVAALCLRLRAGEVLALPTDTLYGLCANALDPAAVARVFDLKGRAADQPLPLVVRDRAQAAGLSRALPPLFDRLAAAFWPGPLTLIVPAAAHLPEAVTAGRGSVALRQPASPVLAAILAALDFPLTATSANRTGEPAAASAAEVEAALGAQLGCIVDAGPAPRRLPSTLLDLTLHPPRLVRAGAVPEAELAAFFARASRS